MNPNGHYLIALAGGPDGGEVNTLQGALSKIVDGSALLTLSQIFERKEEWIHVRRLHELRDKSTSHEWASCINSVHGPVLEPDLLLTALKIRVGIPLVDNCGICPYCGIKVMDNYGLHSLCCANSASTKRHYLVRDRVLDLARLADPTALTEVLGLIPCAPSLRPADIFTSAAIPGRSAALDIGICSLDACNAGLDCCDFMHQGKVQKYEKYYADKKFHIIECPLPNPDFPRFSIRRGAYGVRMGPSLLT